MLIPLEKNPNHKIAKITKIMILTEKVIYYGS